MKKQASFTLIELLVVIAIIGLLASIVVVNVNSARDKAKKAKALQFSQSLYHGLGDAAVGYWTFDEGSGTTVRDFTGNGNNGTWQGSGTHWSTSEKIIGAAAGQFDGGDYVSVPVSSSLKITSNITIEAWVYIHSLSGTPNITNAGGDELQLYITGAGILRRAGSIGGTWYDQGANTPLATNKWQHVVFSYDGSNGKFYTNGNPDGSFPATGALASASGNFYIGCYSPSLRFFDGFIDELRIYSKSLTSAEIQQHYAEGLERHQLVKN